MADYVSRDDVLKAIDYQHEVNNVFESEAAYVQMWETINDDIGIKSADVQAVRHGRWESIRNVKLIDAIKRCECNQCHNKIYGGLSYCGNCGARMDGDKNG